MQYKLVGDPLAAVRACIARQRRISLALFEALEVDRRRFRKVVEEIGRSHDIAMERVLAIKRYQDRKILRTRCIPVPAVRRG